MLLRLWESGNPAGFAGFPSWVEKWYALFHPAPFPQPVPPEFAFGPSRASGICLCTRACRAAPKTPPATSSPHTSLPESAHHSSRSGIQRCMAFPLRRMRPQRNYRALLTFKWHSFHRLRKKPFWRNLRKINRAQLAQDARSFQGDDFAALKMLSIRLQTDFFRNLFILCAFDFVATPFRASFYPLLQTPSAPAPRRPHLAASRYRQLKPVLVRYVH